MKLLKLLFFPDPTRHQLIDLHQNEPDDQVTRLSVSLQHAVRGAPSHFAYAFGNQNCELLSLRCIDMWAEIRHACVDNLEQSFTLHKDALDLVVESIGVNAHKSQRFLCCN